jgi:hypothetical protein
MRGAHFWIATLDWVMGAPVATLMPLPSIGALAG